MSMETFRGMVRRPFQLREFLDQTWMIARVSLLPTLLVAIPFTVLVSFTLNILLREIGAAALSGAGTALDRKSTRLNSSHVANSYGDFSLKNKKYNQMLIS